jgi:Ankyrin repeats (3 copies)
MHTRIPHTHDEIKKLAQEIFAELDSYNISSSTLPSLKDKTAIRLYNSKIKQMRKIKPTLSESIWYVLQYPMKPRWRKTKFDNKRSKHHKLGNCHELSCIVANFYRKKNVSKVEIMSIVGSDHVIVAVDRQGHINDPKTWNCMITDGLNRDVYHSSEIYDKLKKYKHDLTKPDPHILTLFTPQDRLKIQCKIELQPFNQEQFDTHLKKIHIIAAACKKYLKEEQLAQFLKIKLEFSNDDQLSQLTNFELERETDKHIKIICQFIDHQSTRHKIFAEICLNMAGIYPSYSAYFKEYFKYLCQHDDLFDYIKDQLEKNPDYLPLLTHLKQNVNVFLPIAIAKENFEVMYFLLSHGADAAVTDKLGLTVLHAAVKEGRHDFIAYLIAAKSIHNIINQQNNDGWTALHLAVFNNRFDTVKLLLDTGADPNIVDEEDNTPLMLAEIDNNTKIVDLLKIHMVSNSTSSMGQRKGH